MLPIMTTAADPTIRALDRFSDKSRWVIEDAVPVFDEHDEHDAQGVIVRKFGLAELREIADNCNRREIETGDAVPITLGHTREGAAETDQPPIVGYARRFRVGHFGPKKKLGIVCTMYFQKDRYPEAMQYPRRSVELWLQERIFDPVALLKRTPKRDLGLLTFAAKRNRLLYSLETYAMPEYMPEHMHEMPLTPGTKPEHLAVADMSPVPHPHPDFGQGHEHEHHDEHIHKVMSYLADHPVFKYAHHMYMKECGGSEHHQAGAGVASGTNTFTPGVGETRHHPMHMQKETPPAPAAAEQQRVQQAQADIEVSRYQREAEASKAALDQLRGEVESMKRETRVAKYERDLGHLVSQGYELDLAEELTSVSDLTAEQFAKHCERIKKHYQRKPVGNNFLELAPEAHEGGRPRPSPISKEERDAAISLASRGDAKDNPHYGNFDGALKYIRDQKNVLVKT